MKRPSDKERLDWLAGHWNAALWLGGVYWGADHAQDVMGPCSQQVRP